MSSSQPADDKEKAQMAPSSSETSSEGKGEAAPGQQMAYVVGVPPQQVTVPAWSTGLFECFDDLPTFIITFFAPCVTFGQVAEIVDRGQGSCTVYALVYTLVMYFTGCGCLMSAYYRMKMAHQYKLPDDPLINILVHLLCEPCALCQEHRELRAHGFNMQIGVPWNEQPKELTQPAGVMDAPKVPGGMDR